ncbi:MAG: 50S ribosomal protein L44e [Candidatus Woesearchaeota archaeon]
MKIPKTLKRHCPYCKKHTEHTVSQSKKKGQGSVHTQSRSSKTRLRSRGSWRGHGNQGRFSRPPIGSRKMSGKKLTKKTDFRYTCKTCGKQHNQSKGIRVKKIEII